MIERTVKATAVFLLLFSCRGMSQSERLPDERIIAGVDSALGRLVQMHQEVKEIHPFLARLHPVAVLEGDTLFIFDFDTTGDLYRFQQKVPVPFPMQKGIRASFPLSSNGNRPTCVVSLDVFDSREGYATMFHEFVHCSQALTCENSLKQGLHVARAAMEAKDYSWEINHRFVYRDSTFAEAYTRFLQALEGGNSGALQQSGRDQPYDRVTFYYGGEKCITYIARRHGGGIPDVSELFTELSALPGGN
jgi:hypothetical protein